MNRSDQAAENLWAIEQMKNDFILRHPMGGQRAFNADKVLADLREHGDTLLKPALDMVMVLAINYGIELENLAKENLQATIMAAQIIQEYADEARSPQPEQHQEGSDAQDRKG